MKIDCLAIIYPSGNRTALVFDDIPEYEFKKVNDFIQDNDPFIEQVMFVRLKDKLPCGLMAGGEFCGNATRSLGYYLLRGRPGSVEVQVSGADRPLTVCVHDGKAKVDVPLLTGSDPVTFLGGGMWRVRLPGISHLVLEAGSAEADRILAEKDDRRRTELAKELLVANGLIDEPACGVMALADEAGVVAVQPFVYVRQLDAICRETACGSGTIAVGLVRAGQSRESLKNFSLRQPSGEDITVDVVYANGACAGAAIDGKVQLLYEGSFPTAEG